MGERERRRGMKKGGEEEKAVLIETPSRVFLKLE